MSKKADKLIKSATLILTSALKQSPQSSFDYKINLLKRTQKMRVLPGFHVFPGGKFDQALDDTADWLEVFLNREELNLVRANPGLIKRQYFNSLINERSLGNLIKGNNVGSKPMLPFEVAFRICAIRETFEETGVLIAVDRKKASFNRTVSTDYYRDDGRLDSIRRWHEDVLKDSTKFMQMCLKLDLVPNVFALHEWANWITPEFEKFRFDTFFFNCFLNTLPDEKYLLVNTGEIERVDFFTPQEALDKHKHQEIKFIPPQLYELNRFTRFRNFQNLAEFSFHRQKYGLQPWLPKFDKHFKFGFLPGDYMYDDIDDTYDEQKDAQTIAANKELKLNRIKRYVDKQTEEKYYEITCNYHLDGNNNNNSHI